MRALAYSEEILAHQEPVKAVSDWQQYNDADGSDAIAHEMDMIRASQYEASIRMAKTRGQPIKNP